MNIISVLSSLIFFPADHLSGPLSPTIMSRKRRKKGKQRSKRDPKALYARGFSYFRQGLYRQAIAEWHRALKAGADPDLSLRLAEAHFREGVRAYGEDGGQESIAQFQQAVRYNETNPLYPYHLGLAYHKRNKLDQARSWYERAVGADPDNPRFLYHLGLCRIQAGEVREGTDLLLKSGKVSPGLASTLVGEEKDGVSSGMIRGVMLLKTGEFAGAKRALKKLEDPTSIYALGLTYLADNRLPTAAKLLEQSLEKGVPDAWVRPYLSPVYARLARTYVKRESYGKAARVWEGMIRAHIDESRARRNLVHAYLLQGSAYVQREKLKEAIACWEEVEQLDPKNTDVQHNLAVAYDRQGKEDVANRYWKKAIQGWRSSPDRKDRRVHLAVAYRHLADNHLQLEEPYKAVKAYETAVNYATEDVRTMMKLADVYASLERFDSAIQTYRKALRIAPQDKELLTGLATVYAESFNLTAAASCWEKVLALDPQDRVIREQIVQTCIAEAGLECTFSRNTRKALRILSIAERLVPEDTRVHGMIGTMHLSQNDPEAADAAFHRACGLTPDDAKPYLNAGRQYTIVRMFPKAEEYFDEALKRFPEDVDVYLEIGGSYARADGLKKARKYFRKAIRLRVEDAHIPVRVAVLLIEAKCFEDAIPYLHEARAIAPAMPDVYYHLAYAYFRDDQKDKAKPMLRKARQLARSEEDTELLEAINSLEYTMAGLFFPFGGRTPLSREFTDDEEW